MSSSTSQHDASAFERYALERGFGSVASDEPTDRVFAKGSLLLTFTPDRGAPLVTFASVASPRETFPVESVVSYLQGKYELLGSDDETAQALEAMEAEVEALFSPGNTVGRQRLKTWCLELNQRLIQRALNASPNPSPSPQGWWRKLWS